jgi:hypothetical protein
MGANNHKELLKRWGDCPVLRDATASLILHWRRQWASMLISGSSRIGPVLGKEGPRIAALLRKDYRRSPGPMLLRPDRMAQIMAKQRRLYAAPLRGIRNNA